MAIIINPYFRGSTGQGILEAMFQTGFISGGGVTRVLRIYPSTVPYPASSIASTSYSMPSGFILEYPQLVFSKSGSSIILLGGELFATAASAGTAAWWSLTGLFDQSSFANNGIASDSIGSTGSGAIVTLSSMTISSGQFVSVNFNLAAL